MTALRRRMIEDMQLRGLSPHTQRAYVQAIQRLALYYHKSPDQITDEELRQYFLYLRNEKRVARSTATLALCACSATVTRPSRPGSPVREGVVQRSTTASSRI
jgi:integrase/recombinase XerD